MKPCPKSFNCTKMKASTVFAVIFGWCILSLAGHTMWKVMWFLSSFPAAPITQNSSINESHQSLWSLLMSLWFDACLVLLFIFQHRVLKTRDIENYLANHALPPVAARSIYVLLSSMALQVHNHMNHSRFFSNSFIIVFSRSLSNSGLLLTHTTCGHWKVVVLFRGVFSR